MILSPNCIPPTRNLCILFPVEYKAWGNIKIRCYNKKTPYYKNYGGRGIRMSKRWFHSFREFLKDMGTRPSPKHSIDRIDNDKGYSRKNCRWATRAEQAENRRTQSAFHWAKKITHKGITDTIERWARRPEIKALGITAANIRMRIHYGWSFEKAISTKPSRYQKTGKYKKRN